MLELTVKQCLNELCGLMVADLHEFGFTFCHEHLSAARRIIPLPAGFVPNPNVEAYPNLNAPTAIDGTITPFDLAMQDHLRKEPS